MTAIAAPIAKGTLRQWGNSLALRFPTEVLKMSNLHEGVEIGFHVSSQGEIVLRPAFPSADDQEGLRALYLSLIAEVTPDMEGYEDEDALWEPAGDEIE